MSKSLFLCVFSLILTISMLGVTRSSFAATVTNTNDSGPGSLREKIGVASAGATVSFALTGCPCTIVSNRQASLVNFGLPGDNPVPADYDGDGSTDRAVYLSGEWHLLLSGSGYTVANFGLANDKPVPADYDGDGKADLAVYRNGTWYLQRSAEGFSTFQWGIATDVPAPGDYDGDGKTDPAVFRDGTWYVLISTGGVSVQQFGLADDEAIPATYLP